MKPKNFNDKIETIRSAMKLSGCSSHTSLKYQDDIIDLIIAGEKCTGDIIELGCYLGGMTALMAYACQIVGKHLYTIDIDPSYIKCAKNELAKLDLLSNTTFFTGNLEVFLESEKFENVPYACIVDGDHRYKGVVADVKSITKHIADTPNFIFHDYSLRYTEKSGLSEVRVDKAIHDTFPDFIHVLPIGEKAGEGKTLRTVPDDDGHYHENGKYEGALVRFK